MKIKFPKILRLRNYFSIFTSKFGRFSFSSLANLSLYTIISIPITGYADSGSSYNASIVANEAMIRIEQQMRDAWLANMRAQSEYNAVLLNAQMNIRSQADMLAQQAATNMLMNNLYIDYSAINGIREAAIINGQNQFSLFAPSAPKPFDRYPYEHAINEIYASLSFSSSGIRASGSGTSGLFSGDSTGDNFEDGFSVIAGSDTVSVSNSNGSAAQAPSFSSFLNLDNQLFSFSVTGQINSPTAMTLAPVSDTGWLVSNFSSPTPITFSFDLSSLTMPFSPNLDTNMLAAFNNPYLVAVEQDFSALVPPSPPTISVASLNPVAQVQTMFESGGEASATQALTITELSYSGVVANPFGNIGLEDSVNAGSNQLIQMQDGQFYLVNSVDGTFVNFSHYLDQYWSGNTETAANPFYIGYYFPRFSDSQPAFFGKGLIDISLIPNINERVAANQANIDSLAPETLQAILPISVRVVGQNGLQTTIFGTAFNVETPNGVQTITNGHVVSKFAREEGSASGDVDIAITQGPAVRENESPIILSNFVSHLSYATNWRADGVDHYLSEAFGGTTSQGISDYAVIEVNEQIRPALHQRSVKLSDEPVTVGTEVLVPGFPTYHWNSQYATERPLVVVRAVVEEVSADGVLKLRPVDQKQMPFFKGMSGGTVIRADDGRTTVAYWYGLGSGNFGWGVTMTSDANSQTGIRMGGTNTFRQPACTATGENC